MRYPNLPDIESLLDTRRAIDPLRTPIKHQETLARLDMEQEMQTLRSLIAAKQHLLQMASHPSYTPFCKELARLRENANKALVQGTDVENMMREQGKVLAYDAILSLLPLTEAGLKPLADRLEAVENEHRARVRPDGRLLPKGVTQ